MGAAPGGARDRLLRRQEVWKATPCGGLPGLEHVVQGVGSGATWGEMVPAEDMDLFLTVPDIKDFFYACGMPAELSRFFALPDVPIWLARELSGGEAMSGLGDDSWVAPAFTLLPMGFK